MLVLGIASEFGGSARGDSTRGQTGGRGSHRDGQLHPTETPRSRPMTAVTAIAKPPPIVTRNAAGPSGAPPRWPPNAPRAPRLTRDNTVIARMPCDEGA